MNAVQPVSVVAVPLTADFTRERLPLFQAVAALLATGDYAVEIPHSRMYLLDNRHGRGFRLVGLMPTAMCYPAT